MRVLSYDPQDDSFFVDAAWDEYRQPAAEYEIDAGGADAEEVIEIQKDYRRELAEEVFDASYPFRQYLRDLYGIDDMPEVCLVVKRDLSGLWVDHHPFHHLWNGESPWIKIKPAAIRDLTELAAGEYGVCLPRLRGKEIRAGLHRQRLQEKSAGAGAVPAGKHAGAVLRRGIERHRKEEGRPSFLFFFSGSSGGAQ